jgi:hypothetical protein
MTKPSSLCFEINAIREWPLGGGLTQVDPLQPVVTDRLGGAIQVATNKAASQPRRSKKLRTQFIATVLVGSGPIFQIE